MDNTSILATIKNNNIYCGKCGHKIATCNITKALGNKVWILCHHKAAINKWDKCSTLNQIDI